MYIQRVRIGISSEATKNVCNSQRVEKYAIAHESHVERSTYPYQWDICTPLDTIRNIQTISFIPDLVSLLKSLYRT